MSGIDSLAELLRRAPIGAVLDASRHNRYSPTRELADDSGGCQEPKQAWQNLTDLTIPAERG